MKIYIGMSMSIRSLVRNFGIFNHIGNLVSKRIARQLYFALIHSRIQYGMETYGTCAKDALDSTCNQVENFTSIHYMLKTKYELSLRPKLIVSYLPHKVLLPNFPLRYSTGGRVRLSVDAEDITSESLGGAHWHPSVGGVLWPSLVVASHECVPAAIYAPMGPFSWFMVGGPALVSVSAGGLRGTLPWGHGIHESSPLHQWTANHSQSFGCQQDEPSAFLVTTNRIYNVY